VGDARTRNARLDCWFERECLFFDIGAGFGNETLYAALKPNGPREIACFDLDLHTSLNLAYNLQINEIMNVKQYYLGIADGAGFVHANEYRADLGVPGRPVYERIACRTFGRSLDEFIEHTGDQPDYIKIDVDGFEDRGVKAMYQTLRSPQLKSLLIEVNAVARAVVLQGLADAGFVESGRVALGADAENIIFRRRTPRLAP